MTTFYTSKQGHCHRAALLREFGTTVTDALAASLQALGVQQLCSCAVIWTAAIATSSSLASVAYVPPALRRLVDSWRPSEADPQPR